MANIQSAKKRIRQTAKRTTANRVYLASARTHIKKANQLIEAGDLDDAEVVVQQACSTLDKAARKHILHPGNVSRRKGRLMAKLASARATD